MKKFLLIVLVILLGSTAHALSFSATNPGAANMARYYQTNPYNYRRATRNNIPYVYSEQQAKYYGINVANPNAQYRTYGLYKQNYTNNNMDYTQRYGY